MLKPSPLVLALTPLFPHPHLWPTSCPYRRMTDADDTVHVLDQKPLPVTKLAVNAPSAVDTGPYHKLEIDFGTLDLKIRQ
jgi:hypothetical protein